MRTTSAHSVVDIQIVRKLPWQGSFRRTLRTISHSSDAPSLREPQQMSSRHEQIRQCRHNEQTVAVLHHAAIADLGKAKDALDDEKGMLDLGAYTRFPTVLLQFPFGESLVAKSFLVG